MSSDDYIPFGGGGAAGGGPNTQPDNRAPYYRQQYHHNSNNEQQQPNQRGWPGQQQQQQYRHNHNNPAQRWQNNRGKQFRGGGRPGFGFDNGDQQQPHPYQNQHQQRPSFRRNFGGRGNSNFQPRNQQNAQRGGYKGSEAFDVRRYVHPSMLENPWREFDECRAGIDTAEPGMPANTDSFESEANESPHSDDEVDD